MPLVIIAGKEIRLAIIATLNKMGPKGSGSGTDLTSAAFTVITMKDLTPSRMKRYLLHQRKAYFSIKPSTRPATASARKLHFVSVARFATYIIGCDSSL